MCVFEARRTHEQKRCAMAVLLPFSTEKKAPVAVFPDSAAGRSCTADAHRAAVGRLPPAGNSVRIKHLYTHSQQRRKEHQSISLHGYILSKVHDLSIDWCEVHFKVSCV